MECLILSVCIYSLLISLTLWGVSILIEDMLTRIISIIIKIKYEIWHV